MARSSRSKRFPTRSWTRPALRTTRSSTEIAEFDDELTETYLEDEAAVTPEMIRRALRAGTLAGRVTPVLAGSAFKNKGVQPLLDAIVDYLPSPLDVPPVQGVDPKSDGGLTRPPR